MEHEAGNGLVHRAAPAQPGSLETPGSYACAPAFLGRKSTYFLEGLKGTLGYTTTVSGVAGADYPQTNSPNRSSLLPSLPSPLYLSALRLRQVLAPAPAAKPAPPGHRATGPAGDP